MSASDPDKQRVLEYLSDLAEAAIGELPFQVIDIVQMKTDFRFTLEHITDGEVEFTLPVQVIYLHDCVVQIMMDREIEHILVGQCQLRGMRVHSGEKQSEIVHGFRESDSLGPII